MKQRMTGVFNLRHFVFLPLLALLIRQPRPANGIQWLALSKISSVASTGGQPEQMCDAMKASLVKKQINFCKKNPSFMDSVRIGAARAIDECQFQFRSTRWNCSAMGEKINTEVDKMKSDLGLMTQDFMGHDRKQSQFPGQFGGQVSGFGSVSMPNGEVNPHDSMYNTNPNVNNNSNSNKRRNSLSQTKAKHGKRLSRKARHGLTDENFSPNKQRDIFGPDVVSFNNTVNLFPDRANDDQDDLDEETYDDEDGRKRQDKKRRKGKPEILSDKASKKLEAGKEFQNSIGGPYPVVAAGTRESAFVHAISSAGVAHALTRACSSGELDNCGCDRSLKGISPEGFQWSGCSDNIDFGITFSRNFVDARDRRKSREKPKKDQPLMNLHNNEAGRKLLERNMKIECKCHGVSGSCELKTCWRSVASFRLVGEILKEKFDSAHEVQQKKRRGRRMLLPKSQWFKPLTDTDLVYLRASSDYCEFDVKKGSLGTHGRECDPRSPGIDGCELMCCNRGYTTRREPRKERCRCKFHWCCYVECEECYNEVEVSTCN